MNLVGVPKQLQVPMLPCSLGSGTLRACSGACLACLGAERVGMSVAALAVKALECLPGAGQAAKEGVWICGISPCQVLRDVWPCEYRGVGF